ncbi:MAG: hypothetical protein AMJ94_17530 [Deltaproteobacteria bacterium SM23_61]|nr:MAG: hypothetical protein AMJ94_17530 [Deltaproteobacteria bacterium SM23_61]
MVGLPKGLNPLSQHSSFSICSLCVLRLLFVHPLVYIPGGSKQKEQSMLIKRFLPLVFTQKKLCDLCVLCG